MHAGVSRHIQHVKLRSFDQAHAALSHPRTPGWSGGSERCREPWSAGSWQRPRWEALRGADPKRCSQLHPFSAKRKPGARSPCNNRINTKTQPSPAEYAGHHATRYGLWRLYMAPGNHSVSCWVRCVRPRAVPTIRSTRAACVHAYAPGQAGYPVRLDAESAAIPENPALRQKQRVRLAATCPVL